VAIGDKYNRFTQYLQMKHVEGIDSITLTFPEIEKIWGFPISDSMYRYAWANDKTQSYSVGWMRAGYVVTKCDLPEKKISFCYDQNRADMLLNRESVAHRKKSTGLRVKRPEEVCDYLPITAENLEKYNQLVENDPGYGTDGEIIHNVLSAYPLNRAFINNCHHLIKASLDWCGVMAKLEQVGRLPIHDFLFARKETTNQFSVGQGIQHCMIRLNICGR